MSGNPDIPVSNRSPRLLNHTYHAAYQIKLDFIDLVNGQLTEYLWLRFGHLPGPRVFRITVPLPISIFMNLDSASSREFGFP